MATTDLGIPYPDDYEDPADSPAAMAAMAIKTDELISGRVVVGRAINTTAPLTGGGTLETNRTLAITPGYYARVFVQASQPAAGNIGDIWVPV